MNEWRESEKETRWRGGERGKKEDVHCRVVGISLWVMIRCDISAYYLFQPSLPCVIAPRPACRVRPQVCSGVLDRVVGVCVEHCLRLWTTPPALTHTAKGTLKAQSRYFILFYLFLFFSLFLFSFLLLLLLSFLFSSLLLCYYSSFYFNYLCN